MKAYILDRVGHAGKSGHETILAFHVSHYFEEVSLNPPKGNQMLERKTYTLSKRS